MNTQLTPDLGQKQKKKRLRTFDLFLALVVTSLGAIFFLCITRSLGGVAFFNPWISAMLCAVIFETVLSLFAVTVGPKKIIAPIVIIAFLPSIIFLPVFGHAIVVLLAILIAIRGLYIMRHTLFNGLKINMSVIVRSGIAYVSFALVLTVTSQYYFFTKNNSEALFDANRYVNVSNIALDYILKKSNADNISLSTMTVDQFLQFMIDNVYTQDSEVQGPQVSDEDSQIIVRWAHQAGINIDSIEQNVKENVLDQMRMNVSDLVGRDVGGNEMIQNVFSEIISKQINQVIAGNAFLNKSKVLIFSFLFFIIIFSLAAFVKVLAVWCTRLIFFVLRESKVIHVSKTQRDAEVIVF